jgi:hypothetical protein
MEVPVAKAIWAVPLSVATLLMFVREEPAELIETR